MTLPRDAMLLRVFIGENAKYHHRALYKVIVQKAREAHLAGRRSCGGQWALAIRRGCTRRKSSTLAENLPLVIEIVDTEDKIKAFLPVLDAVMPGGLVTLEKVQVLYGEDVKHDPA